MTSTVFVCESAFESQHAKGVPRDDSSRSVPGLKLRERSAGRASEPRSTAFVVVVQQASAARSYSLHVSAVSGSAGGSGACEVDAGNNQGGRVPSVTAFARSPSPLCLSLGNAAVPRPYLLAALGPTGFSRRALTFHASHLPLRWHSCVCVRAGPPAPRSDEQHLSRASQVSCAPCHRVRQPRSGFRPSQPSARTSSRSTSRARDATACEIPRADASVNVESNRGLGSCRGLVGRARSR